MQTYGTRITMILFCISLEVDCQCNIPLSNGTWLTSSRGTWSVDSNSQVIENVETSLSATQPSSTLTCETQSGTKYVFSTTVEVFADISITSYICIDIRTTSNSPAKYIFYFVTAVDPSHGDHFTTNQSIACTNSNYETPSNTHIIIMDGSVLNATSTLPDVIRGNYSVSFTDVDGSNVSGSTMDSCSDVTTLAFNLSESSRKIGLSESGVLFCVYTVTVDDLHYVITYNNDTTVDSSSTYRFACWVFSYSSSEVVSTVYPRACQSNQNSTTVPSGGQLLKFLASEVCPDGSSAEDDDEGLSTALIIVIVIMSCLLVGIGITIAICILKHKGKLKNNEDQQPLEKIRPDTFTTVIENKESRDKQENGVQSPTNPSITEKTCDRPMTRWSKSRHRKIFGRQKSVAESKTNSSLISGYADTNITIRRAYVSMAPTSLLFTGINNRAFSKDGPLSNGPEMLNRRSKTMVESRKRKHAVSYKDRKTKVESSENTRKRLETLQMIRTKTFHDFSREFDKLKPFPEGNEETKAQCISDEKASTIKSENTKKDIEVTDKDSSKTQTRPSTLKSRPSTTGHLVNRLDTTKSPAKRTQSETAALANTTMGFSYNSPYALTPQQKQYFAERALWIRQMKSRGVSEEKELTEKRNQENTAAYKAWLKNKAAGSQRLKQFYMNNKRKRKLRMQLPDNKQEIAHNNKAHSSHETIHREQPNID